MNSLLHREGDDDLDDLGGTKDREITLGTTMILGIFFALAVLCAVFFGFGYQLGRKSVVTSPVAAVTSAQPANFAGFKPAAGSPAGSAPDTTSGQTIAVPNTSAPAAGSPAPRATPQSAEESDNDASNDPPVTPATASTAPTSRPPSSPGPASTTTVPTGAGAIVQIAAVSHQEDADLLVSTLKRRGYSVAIHTEPQDKLLHVQIGPFTNRKEADAMRQRLLGDGFNAIVK